MNKKILLTESTLIGGKNPKTVEVATVEGVNKTVQEAIQEAEGKYQGVTKGSIQIGENSVAGCKGFYYKYVDFADNKIYLTNKQVVPNTNTDNEVIESLSEYAVGDVISIVNDLHYELCCTITAIENNIITVDKLPFSEIAPITELNTEEYTLLVNSKPNVGNVEIGTNAFAGGEDSKATGRDSIAYGINALAAGNYSAVFGKNGIGAYGTIVSGKNNTASADYSAAFNQGNVASGNNAMAINRNNVASGLRSFASGEGTEASGSGSHSEGYQTKATNNNAHTEGNGTLASGPNSHAEGLNSKATAESAHAEGSGTTASGKYAHAEGRITEATNNSAHAEGNTTHALGYASHAEGQDTYAYGVNTHAEGWATIAGDKSDPANKGKHAHAEGANTIAKGRASHAEGGYTIASGEYQHVGGRYNVENSNLAEIIGNGSNTKRSNARELDWNGNEKLSGTLTAQGVIVGSTNVKQEFTSLNNSITEIKNLIGKKNGIAGLDAMGKVPSAQLPSYVDDVLLGRCIINDDAESADEFIPDDYEEAIELEADKIYIDKQTNKTYRWNGDDATPKLVEISASLALGETSSTAYAGDKGKANADAISGLTLRMSAVESKATTNATAITNMPTTIVNYIDANQTLTTAEVDIICKNILGV